MTTSLYLDTARLGRMCPDAQAADQDFAQLASEEGCTLYFEHFLRWGYTALPPSLAHRYSGLSHWAGVPAFKNDLKTVVGLPRERMTLIANRSAQLVRLAARLLCLRCQNILVTDMEWPAYMAALTAECRRMHRAVTMVPVRQSLFRDGIGREELIDRLAAYYCTHDCDGLFLSAVTYQGVRLPVRELLGALGEAARPRLVVVDGAQAINHVPLGLGDGYCDLLLAGCHKWLRAYHPMGLAFCCRATSEGFVNTVCHQMLVDGELDDPLLSFTRQLEGGTLETYSETVNLAPMFTAAAAVRRMLKSSRTKPEELSCQVANARQVTGDAPASGWRPLRPSEPLQTGILLLEAKSRDTRTAPIEMLRQRFLTAGIALTAYDGGLIRASLPDALLGGHDHDLLRSALDRCA
jgi:hypothetical protein